MTTPSVVLLLSFASSAFMTGLIWFVQVVHYPLFSSVGERHFEVYEQEHVRRTGFVVAPVMILELLTAIWLVITPPPWMPRSVAVLALALVIAVWLSTAFWQVPAHRKLSEGFDANVLVRLVRSNLVRAVLWTGRTLILLVAVLGEID